MLSDAIRVLAKIIILLSNTGNLIDPIANFHQFKGKFYYNMYAEIIPLRTVCHLRQIRCLKMTNFFYLFVFLRHQNQNVEIFEFPAMFQL